MYLGSGLCNSAEVVDHVSLGHTDTGIPYTEDLGVLICTDTDVKLLLRVENRRIG